MKNSHTPQTVCKNGYFSYFLKVNVFILSFLFLLCENLNSQTLSAEQIYEKVKDAVVVILAYDYADELAAQGSGVILNDKGYVVTNYHVLTGNERLEIMHGEEIIPYVDIIGINVEKDILILKIEEKKFPAVKLGDVKSLKVGQRVYAIGSPMGFENTISEGIISGLRSYEELSKNYIQITASISPGSSGGAVVNDKGELIGISTLTAKEGQNLNFAIPIDDIFNLKIESYLNNNAYKDYEYFYNGIDLLKKGNNADAVKQLSIFIEKYPDNATVYWFRGYAKMEQNNINSAIQDFSTAITIDPNFTEAYYGRGEIKIKIKEYEKAILDYNMAIQSNPNYSLAYYSRSLSKSLLNDYIDALKDINQAIEIDPSTAYYYSLRGIIKNSLNDKYGACKDFSRAGELGDYKAYEYIKSFCK
jgi:tetratricopeptide (TPR) repeat protein